MRRLILVPLLLAGCSQAGSAVGPIATRDFPASGFTAVDLRGADDVAVTVGPGFAVHATGPQEVLDALDIRVEAGVLRVGRKSGLHTLRSTRGARIAVSMPGITAATLHGAGNLTVDRVRGPSFSAAIEGTGDLSVAAVESGAVSLSVTGAGDLSAAGRADRLSVSLRGTGGVDAAQLKVRNAQIGLTGLGDVNANVTETAAVSLTGLGDVTVAGGARCTIARTGMGNVSCG